MRLSDVGGTLPQRGLDCSSEGFRSTEVVQSALQHACHTLPFLDEESHTRSGVLTCKFHNVLRA